MSLLLLVLPILILLYLLAIMPGMLGRPDTTPFQGWLYAHRGLHENGTAAPENSLEAFRRAVDAGFGIELDIQLSKDGVVVVFHDDTLKRVCGVEGSVCDYTYDELLRLKLCGTKERIPRLEEVLQLVAGKVPLIVELKLPTKDISLCPIADELLSAYQGVYCVESFNPLGLMWYRRHRSAVVRGQLADSFSKEKSHKGCLYFALQHLLFNFLTKPDFVAYHHKYPRALSRRICQRLYKCLAVAWTIRSREEMEQAKGAFDLFIFEGFLPEQP